MSFLFVMIKTSSIFATRKIIYYDEETKKERRKKVFD